LNKPSKSYPNFDKGTSTLVFKGEEDNPREFYMIGGICWPVQYELPDQPPDVLGYAILAGKDLETGIVYVFEQKDFVTIEHIFNEKQIVAYHGLAPWFNTIWARYYANRFYFNQSDEISRKYRLDVIRSEMITSRPQMIEVPMPDIKDALHTVWRYAKTKGVKIDADSLLGVHLPLAKVDKHKRNIASPPVHALACMLVGLDRFPYRKP